MTKKYLLIIPVILFSLLLTGCFALNDEIVVYNTDNEILNKVTKNSTVEDIGIIIFNAKKNEEQNEIDLQSFDYKIELKGNVNETYLFKKNEDGTGTLLNEYDETVTYSLDKTEAHNLYVLMLDIIVQVQFEGK